MHRLELFDFYTCLWRWQLPVDPICGDAGVMKNAYTEMFTPFLVRLWTRWLSIVLVLYCLVLKHIWNALSFQPPQSFVHLLSPAVFKCCGRASETLTGTLIKVYFRLYLRQRAALVCLTASVAQYLARSSAAAKPGFVKRHNLCNQVFGTLTEYGLAKLRKRSVALGCCSLCAPLSSRVVSWLDRKQRFKPGLQNSH